MKNMLGTKGVPSAALSHLCIHVLSIDKMQLLMILVQVRFKQKH